VHVPTALKVTVAPEATQTDVVSDEKATGRELVAVASTGE
jgi:hypothetical protein